VRRIGRGTTTSGKGVVVRQIGWVAVAVALVLFDRAFVGAAVFAVPDSVRQMRVPHEEVHLLRARESGTPVGEQRFRAVVENDTLVLEVATSFNGGEQWDEHCEMSLGRGYRAKSFHKVARRAGKVVGEQRVDFATGLTSWVRDGESGERTFAFAPDTYLGPMLGVVLAAVTERPHGEASFETVVFRPEPHVYTIRAAALGEESFRVGDVFKPTTKVRLKADLGPMQNVLFAPLIPTHYFWFTRNESPEFFAFEGELGYGGQELSMLPERWSAASVRNATPPLTLQ